MHTSACTQAHDPITGPLQPRFFYRYRTVRNGLEVTDTPKPPRPSKYVHDNSPTLVARDFELVRRRARAPTICGACRGCARRPSPNVLSLSCLECGCVPCFAHKLAWREHACRRVA